MGKGNKKIGRRCTGTKRSTRGKWCDVENNSADALAVRKEPPGNRRLDESPICVYHAFQTLLCVAVLDVVWHDASSVVKEYDCHRLLSRCAIRGIVGRHTASLAFSTGFEYSVNRTNVPVTYCLTL